MALSNWATLAVNQEGPCAGAVRNHHGVTIEIYKNWLYVQDPKGWDEETGFVGPYVMQINEGDISFKGWKVIARRGPQNGVFVVAYSAGYDKESKSEDYQAKYIDRRILVGCGVYGYSSHEEMYRTEIEALGGDFSDPKLMVHTEYSPEGETLVVAQFHEAAEGEEKGHIVELGRIEKVDDVPFVGVTPESLDFLKAMVAEIADVSWIKNDKPYWPNTDILALDLDAALVGNQGDWFFEGAFGENLSGTPVGETPSEPILTQVLKQQGAT